MAQIVSGRSVWKDFLETLYALPNNINIWIVVKKLVFAATIYFIWQERNMRHFQEKKRKWKDLWKVIEETVITKMLPVEFQDEWTPSSLGNGLKTSLWYDRWCSLGPLIRLLSPRDIYREGYSLNSCVADLVTNGVWNWPQAWLAKAPDIGSMAAPNLMDCLQWCDANGTKSRFSVICAWEALRPKGVEVSWYNIVWFANSIPRRSFNLWLIMRRNLKTQDNLRAWDVGPNVDLSMLRCPLCDTQRDSHEHLFFECAYSAKVWDYVRVLADLDNVPPTLMDIVATL
ncbi:putative reverse transcriptase domain-containing protein [Tanacetum coccineum]